MEAHESKCVCVFSPKINKKMCVCACVSMTFHRLGNDVIS